MNYHSIFYTGISNLHGFQIMHQTNVKAWTNKRLSVNDLHFQSKFLLHVLTGVYIDIMYYGRAHEILWSCARDIMVVCTRYYGRVHEILWSCARDIMVVCTRYYGRLYVIWSCARDIMSCLRNNFPPSKLFRVLKYYFR